MKIILLLLCLLIGVIGLLWIYSPMFNHGSDGLSGFLPLLFFGALFVGGLVGLAVIGISQFLPPKLGVWLGWIALMIPVLCLLGLVLSQVYLVNSYKNQGLEMQETWRDQAVLKQFDSDTMQLHFPYFDKSNTGSTGGIDNREYNTVTVSELDKEILLLESDDSIVGRIATYTGTTNINSFAEEVFAGSSKCIFEAQSEHPFDSIPKDVVVYKLVQNESIDTSQANSSNPNSCVATLKESDAVFSQQNSFEFEGQIYAFIHPSLQTLLFISALDYQAPRGAVGDISKLNTEDLQAKPWYAYLKIK